MKVTPRVAIDIGDTNEESLNVNDTNPVPVEETKPAKKNQRGKLFYSEHLRYILPLELRKLMRLPIYKHLLLT